MLSVLILNTGYVSSTDELSLGELIAVFLVTILFIVSTFLVADNINSELSEIYAVKRALSPQPNVVRQTELECLANGSNPTDRAKFMQMLKDIDISKVKDPFCYSVESNRIYMTERKEQIIAEYEKFEEYSKVSKEITSFCAFVKPETKEAAIWFIAQDEGWVYRKKMISSLPVWCDFGCCQWNYEEPKEMYIVHPFNHEKLRQYANERYKKK